MTRGYDFMIENIKNGNRTEAVRIKDAAFRYFVLCLTKFNIFHHLVSINSVFKYA